MHPLIERLELGKSMIAAVLTGIREDEAHFRPPSGTWSIVEIVCHLCDEEVEDFRMRLDLTLHSPEREWPKIDPEGAARERRYQDRSLGPELARFLSLREESIALLGGLGELDLDRAHQHPRVGPVPAGDLLASWVAHDLLHVRQIAKRRYEWTQEMARPYGVAYAGPLT